MKVQITTLLLIIAFIVSGCKENNANIESESTPIIEKTTDSVSSQMELVEKENVLKNQNSQKEEVEYEDDEEFLENLQRFAYLDFDKQQVLDRLQLNLSEENRSLKSLLSSELREGDVLINDILETGDGTFDIYRLVSNGIDIARFYYESDYIGTIEIIHYSGTPDDMISPGHTFGDLRKTYDNPVAYGSEIEGRVFVQTGGVGFRMDAGWGIYEPIDLEDDTEILYIQF